MLRPLAILFALLLPAHVGAQTKVFNLVSDEHLEKLLGSFQLKYEKAERKDKETTTVFFDFKRGDHSYRLFNYKNDLWIESTFDKAMKPDEINRWNADAKFSRLVAIKQGDKTTLSLEAQLDCAGGVTDAIIRQFINRFEEETKKFSKLGK
jgi:hypothetical protein